MWMVVVDFSKMIKKNRFCHSALTTLTVYEQIFINHSDNYKAISQTQSISPIYFVIVI